MELMVNIYIFWAKKATIDINIGYYHKKPTCTGTGAYFPAMISLVKKKTIKQCVIITLIFS